MRIFEIETEEIYSAYYSGCFPVSNPADLSDDNALYDGAIYKMCIRDRHMADAGRRDSGRCGNARHRGRIHPYRYGGGISPVSYTHLQAKVSLRQR